jgi:DNA-binding IclR family transcriptional regulator
VDDIMVIKSVAKTIQIINCFSLRKQVLGIGDISAMTGHSKSTVSRLLATLQEFGCVEKAEGYGKYRLGYRIYLWGVISQASHTLPAIAKPIMKNLRERCGEEVSLYGVEGDRRVCLLRVESLHRIARVGLIGELLPLHAGAAGRVLLAYLPEELQQSVIYDQDLNRFTGLTITDPGKLLSSLKKTREQGFAVSRGEREPEAFSVVAPVRDAHRTVVASLSISGPNYRLNRNKLKQNIKDVLKAAEEISHKLGLDRSI